MWGSRPFEAYATTPPPTDGTPQIAGTDRARRLHNHLIRFEDAVHYDAFRARGLAIGSGEVESRHRYVSQDRLKLAGAWWREDNLEPILALRCIRVNGWWAEFWRQAA